MPRAAPAIRDAMSEAAAPPTYAALPTPHAAETQATDPVLHRLKELNETNGEKDALIQKLQNELKRREDKVKELSADKRKEMEEFMKGVVDNWLASLTDVSDTHKSNFREGIKTMAESADVRNPAWEIVCNASRDHLSNVKRIEELLQENTRKDKLIEDLSGFKTQAEAVISLDEPRFKRTRMETASEAPAARQADNIQERSSFVEAPTNNAWDQFYGMIRNDLSGTYY